MKPMTTQVAKTIIELYQNGVAVRVIADLTGHTMSAVNNITYNIYGTYHERKTPDITKQQLMAVIGDVHVIQESHDPA